MITNIINGFNKFIRLIKNNNTNKTELIIYGVGLLSLLTVSTHILTYKYRYSFYKNTNIDTLLKMIAEDRPPTSNGINITPSLFLNFKQFMNNLYKPNFNIKIVKEDYTTQDKAKIEIFLQNTRGYPYVTNIDISIDENNINNELLMFDLLINNNKYRFMNNKYNLNIFNYTSHIRQLQDNNISLFTSNIYLVSLIYLKNYINISHTINKNNFYYEKIHLFDIYNTYFEDNTIDMKYDLILNEKNGDYTLYNNYLDVFLNKIKKYNLTIKLNYKYCYLPYFGYLFNGVYKYIL